MTAKVLEFKQKSGTLPHHRRKDDVVVPAAPKIDKSNREIFEEITEDAMGEWVRHAIKNRLNEYITRKLPHYVKGENVDYVNDLNALSNLEQKLDMKVAVFYPECCNNPYGWIASFKHRDEIFTTPPNLASEANARALNIVLFVSFTYTLKTIGRA
jgi:hypothetical protein